MSSWQWAVGSGQWAVGSSGAHEVGTRERVKETRATVDKGAKRERLTPNAQLLTSNEAGLWAKIRWSDVGEEAVKGGRYRFLSPVWSRSDCEDLGNGRVRPKRLLNAAVTNDPNLKGLRPLSNSGQFAVGNGQSNGKISSKERDQKMANAEALPTTNGTLPTEAKRLEWVLGGNERHCSSCAALIGAHTFTRPKQESSPGRWTEHDDYRTFLKFIATGKLQTRPMISEIVSPLAASEVYGRLAETKHPPLGIVFDWTIV